MPEKIDETPLRRVSREVGDPGLFPPEVHRLFEAGQARKAQAALRGHLGKEPNSARKRRQQQYADDPYLWLEPIKKAPTLHTVNGIGTTLYGKHKPNQDGLYVATLWFVFVFLPIFPLAAYVVRKGQGNLWHFFAKAPLPPFARIWRLGFAATVVAGTLLAAGVGAWTNHTASVTVYNGFDLPLTVTVGPDTLQVPSHAVRDAGRYSKTEPLHLTATPEGWAAPIEELDTRIGALHDRRVLYNPAGRASLVRSWIVYGAGEPADDELLGTPVLTGIGGIDYAFTTPPTSKQVKQGSSITNSVLSNLEDQLPQTVAAFFTQATVSEEDGWRMLAARLALHPDDATTFGLAARVHQSGSPELAAVGDLARAGRPDDVEAHRLYQNTRPPEQQAQIRQEYAALAELHADDPLFQYLAGRTAEDGSPEAEAHFREALTLAPDYAYAHLGLGYLLAMRGDLTRAIAEYAAWAASGPEAAATAVRSRVRLLHVQAAPGWRSQAQVLIDEVAAQQGPTYSTVTLAGGLQAAAGGPALDAALAALPTALGPVYDEEEGLEGALASARLDLAMAARDATRARALMEALDPERDGIMLARAAVSLAMASRDHDAIREALSEHEEAITELGGWFILQAAAAATALGHPSAAALAKAAGMSQATLVPGAAVVLAPDADLSSPAALDALLAPLGLDARGFGYAAAAILLDLGGLGDAATRAHAHTEAGRLLLPDEWAG